MHDTVWFEIQGIPSVFVASSEFGEAAEAQKAALEALGWNVSSLSEEGVMT